jgi:biotin-(acetyl-CoA carboxylase) ligase
MKIIQGAKRLMEQDNPSPRKKPIQEQSQRHQSEPQVSTNDLIKTLMPIMENMIRKVMDEKLTQLLTAQKTQSINENLVLKVGDSIFKGKITGVESSKPKKS